MCPLGQRVGGGLSISRPSSVAPGTYKTAGPAGDTSTQPFCSWKRLRDLRNELGSSTIAFGLEPGQAFVTIEPTDVAFYTYLCMPWQKVS